MAALAERIARYGGEAVEAQRFQVRVAVDTGPVLAAPDGVTGRPSPAPPACWARTSCGADCRPAPPSSA